MCVNIKKLELEGNPVFSVSEMEYDLSSIMFNIVKLDLARTGFTDKCMEALCTAEECQGKFGRLAD